MPLIYRMTCAKKRGAAQPPMRQEEVKNDMENIMYYNGKYLDVQKAAISPFDLGLLRGYGVFDVMRTQNGRPLSISEHWKRFRSSAQYLKLKVPLSLAVYSGVVEKLLRINGFQESIIRTVLTAGPSPDGYSPAGKETFFILIQTFIPLPRNVYLRGATVMTLEYRRECPEAKVTNYVAAIQHYLERTRRHAIEILYIHEKRVLEASASNFFMVQGDKLVTPKEGILRGITRNCVIKLARKGGFEVNERAIALEEALDADEAFITSTNKDIVPIVMIDKNKIGKGTVGSITSAVMDVFNKWLTTR